MSRKCFAAVALMLLCLLPSCSSNSFKVSAKLKGLGQQNVRVAYFNASSGLTDAWVAAQNDELSITGDCTSPTLMMVYNSMGVPIMRLVVSAGDNISITGSITEQYNLQVKGSETLEQWNDFIVKHKSDYNSFNPAKLNAAIEKYVKDNPKSLVSTLLVLVDYAPNDDGNKVARLLEGIDKSAKPEALMESYNVMATRAQQGSKSITSLNLLEMKAGDFESVNFTGGKPSVVLFWNKELDTQARNAAFGELMDLDTTRVQVLDINIDSDSTMWRHNVTSTSTTWKHYWVPGSMMNSAIVKLNITSTPTFIVTDSLGKQIYRGDNPIKTRQTAESL